VFISYSHRDQEKAEILNGHLRGAEIPTYMDRNQLPTGQPYRPELKQALDASSVVVAICTTASMASSEVLFELAYAMGRRVPIIPLRWDTRCKIARFLEPYNFLNFSKTPDWNKLLLQIGRLPAPDGRPEQCQQVGLVEIGSGRTLRKRTDYIHDVLDSAQPDSKLIIVGRSLAEWAEVSENLERSISDKRLEAKLALLDENSLKDATGLHHRMSSWIDSPIPQDWAISDVRRSMDRFRQIQIKANTGSLRIYGLPFYPSHSFVAHTRDDGLRCCLQEAGMAATKVSRPYLILAMPAAFPPNAFGALLEQMNEGVMTPERLVLSNDGQPRSRDTTHHGRILADKVKALGLMDLCASRGEREWFTGSVGTLIDNTPDEGEIFVMGRSLAAWSIEHPQLVRAVAERGVQCTFAIADPTADPKLRSLVKDDYAEVDLVSCWANFLQAADELRKQPKCRGSFQVYGIPAYIPETFGSYDRGGAKFCVLEAGIGFGPDHRVSMYFAKQSDRDVYSHLNKIFRAILTQRKPLIKVP
jgi:hypothetical protein